MKKDKTAKDKKNPKYKKIGDILPFDILSVLGLRPKKLEEKYKKYAGLNRRTLAAFIDISIFMFTLLPVIEYAMSGVTLSRPITHEELMAIKANPETANMEFAKLLRESGKIFEWVVLFSSQALVIIITSGICWKLWGATPGKMILGIKVVDAESKKPPTNKQVVIRCIGYIISGCFLLIGFFWISLNKRRQGWHDMLAKTVVVITSKTGDSGGEEVSEEILEKTIETASSAS